MVRFRILLHFSNKLMNIVSFYNDLLSTSNLVVHIADMTMTGQMAKNMWENIVVEEHTFWNNLTRTWLQ